MAACACRALPLKLSSGIVAHYTEFWMEPALLTITILVSFKINSSQGVLCSAAALLAKVQELHQQEKADSRPAAPSTADKVRLSALPVTVGIEDSE